MKKGLILLISVVSIIFLSGNLMYAQEKTTTPGESTAGAPAEPETLWLWGEVVSVDAANSQIAVKYFDYETDAEKETSIGADTKTTYENVKSIDEIKPADTVSIDYILSASGENVAKNISVEKPESTPEATPEGEASPENLQPEPAPPQEE